MLKNFLQYLIQLTQDLFIPGIVAALMYSYIGLANKKGKITLCIGAAAGVAAAAVMAYFKETTNKVDSEMWNIRIMCVTLAALLVFYIFSNFAVEKIGGKISKAAAAVAAAVVLAGICLDTLPSVFLYPWGFVDSEESILSTEFIFKASGCIFGIIIVLVAALAVKHGADNSDRRFVSVLLKCTLLASALRQLGSALSSLKIRIRTGHIKGAFAVDMNAFLKQGFMTKFTRLVSNHKEYFIYAVMLIVLLLPVSMWIRSFRAHETYDNPAQHRKIRAKWRSRRRWASAAVVCGLISVMNLTVVKAYNEKAAELTPAEDCEMHDGAMYVSLDKVGDGHLHRFAYITENNVDIRFIVIKKPNSQSYGIGLDACDICGKTGYYEKGDQVVCNRCDVVMNTNTIGFKGGCNPIPIEYKIEKGYIIVPISVLAEYEKVFK